MVEIKAGRKFLQRRLLILLVSLPLLVYGVPDAINNVFGYDLTGGMMGDRDPLGPVTFFYWECLYWFTLQSNSPLI